MIPADRVSTTRAWVAGLLAAGAALAVSEVAGLVLAPDASLVRGVADRVIAATPAGPRELLVGLVGTRDKPLLVAGVVAVVLALGAAAGLLERARPGAGRVMVVLVALVGALVAYDPATGGGAVLVAALLGAVAGVLVLVLLLPRPDPQVPPAGSEPTGDASRRAFLVRSGLVGAGVIAGLGVIAATRQGAVSAVERVRTSLRLPAPATAATPLPAAADPQVPGLAPAVTPAEDFYVIDTALQKPVVDVDTWRLAVGGLVDHPFELSYADLLALPQSEIWATLTCVSNEVGGGLVGNARWLGVPLTTLLARAGTATAPSDSLVSLTSVDGFVASFPLALVASHPHAMVAVGMNGEPLPVEHGYPARLIVPGLYGYVSATKWLTDIRITGAQEDVGFWVERGWSADGTIEASSRIDVPRVGASVPAGEVVVAGRAWHQHVGVGAVQVSVDDGPFRAAELAAPMGVDSWRLWTYRWPAAAGTHSLTVRMVGTDGAVQDQAVRPVFPGASSGYHRVEVVVT